MKYLKNTFFVLQDICYWLYNLNKFFYKNLFKSFSIYYFKLIFFMLPYNVAYYSYVLLFKFIIYNSFKYFIGLFYYFFKIFFFLFYIWGCYFVGLFILKNYIIGISELMFNQQLTDIDIFLNLNIFFLMKANLTFLSGVSFDNILSTIYFNYYYDLILNKFIFFDLLKSKYLKNSLTLNEYFDLKYMLCLGWISDINLDLYMFNYKIFYNILYFKYFIRWLLEYFWVFDLIFLQLKYIIWSLFIIISKLVLEYFNNEILIQVFLIINNFFYVLSDVFLLEIGYGIKINLVTFFEWFFSHLFGYCLKLIKFFDISNGVLSSHKKLLFCFNDYNVHKDIEYYNNFKFRVLSTFNFYKGKLYPEALKTLYTRSHYLIEGTPLMETHLNFSLRSVKKSVQSFWFDTEITRLHFSKFNFLSNYYNLNIFNKEAFFSEKSEFFVVADNIFKVKREFAHTGFFSFYNFSTLHVSNFENMNLVAEGFANVAVRPSFFDFGYKEKLYMYNLTFYYQIFLSCFMLFVQLVLSFINILYIYVKLFIYVLFFLVVWRFFILFYMIDFYNQKKVKYFFLNKINKLYEPIFLINKKTFDLKIIWLLNPAITIAFITFLFRNKKLFCKRFFNNFFEIIYFIKRTLKNIIIEIYSRVLILNILIFKYLKIKIFKINALKKYLIFINLNIFKIAKYIYNNFILISFNFFFNFFKCLLIFLIIIFIYNICYLFILVLDILYNISIIDFYPTFIILIFILFLIFFFSNIRNFSENLLGRYNNDNRFFLALDDNFLYDHWDVFVGLTETPSNVLINNNDFNFVFKSNELIKEAGIFITDKGKSFYDFLLLKRFDVFYLGINKYSNKLGFTKLYFKYPMQLFYFLFLPWDKNNIQSYYSFLFLNFFNTFFVHKFRDLSPSTFTSIDFFYNNNKDFLFGIGVNPSKIKRFFCISENIEPRIEFFKNNKWYNDFFINNVYVLSNYDKNFIIVKYKSKFDNNLFSLIKNNLIYFTNLGYFKKIGNFNQFRFIYHPKDLTFDFKVLLNLNYSLFFQKNYIGFQLNYALLDKEKSSFLLYNLYECYDNKYKRRFYNNLNYYKIILNLKLFPYVTNYEHQQILCYFNCNENIWNSVDNQNKKIILNYPFYEFPIFLFLTFHFFLHRNIIEPFSILFSKSKILKGSVYGQRHSFIFNEPVLESTIFFKKCLFFFNLIFEDILLIISLPGYLHENCWRFSKWLYFFLYSFIFVLPPQVINQIICINTINYINIVDFILNLWFFIWRFGIGFGFYDFLFIIF